MLKGIFTSIACLFAMTFSSLAQSNFVDTAFSPALPGTTPDWVNSWIAPDGKILVSGDFCVVNGKQWPSLARLNTDGSLDESFHTDHQWPVDGIAFDDQGRLIVSSGWRLRRLLPGGATDETFIAEDEVRADHTVIANIVTHPDFGIMAASRSDWNGGGGRLMWADNSGRIPILNPRAMAYSAMSIVRDANDQVFVGHRQLPFLTHLNFDGSRVDSTPYLPFDGPVTALAKQNDGKILVGGRFTKAGDVTRHSLARLHVDGTQDHSFAPGTDFSMPLHTTSEITSISSLTNGIIYASALIRQFNQGTAAAEFKVARLHENGLRNFLFNPPPMRALETPATRIVAQPDGKVIVAGQYFIGSGTNERPARLTRLNADGSIDTTFRPRLEKQAYVEALAPRSAGGVFVGAGLFEDGGIFRNRIVAIDSSGKQDTNFNAPELRSVYHIIEQPDSKVLVGGFFNSVNGTNHPGLVRLNADGSLDPTFTPELNIDDRIYTMTRLRNGKLIVVATYDLARLDANGRRERYLPTGPAVNVSSIIETKDGKILVGGYAMGSIGNYRQVVRLTAEGDLDTFGLPYMETGSVSKLFELPDGKILAGGAFRVAGIATNELTGMLRLNADGTIDSSFKLLAMPTNPQIGAEISDFVVLSNGQILICGTFEAIDGSPFRGLARLNADGSLDRTFEIPLAPGNYPERLALSADGESAYVAGWFRELGGIPVSSLARITTQPKPSPTNLLTSWTFPRMSWYGFEAWLRGSQERPVQIEASTNMIDWETVEQTIPGQHSEILFRDPKFGNIDLLPPQRFYRVKVP